MEIDNNVRKEEETVKRVTNELNMPKGFVPDLRSFAGKKEGFATEIGSSNADKIKQKIEAASHKQPVRQPSKLKRLGSKRRQPVINTIAGYRVSKPLADNARIGWTAFSNIENPGGSLGIMATEKQPSRDTVIDDFYSFWIGPFQDDWQDFGVIFIIGIGFWLVVKLRGGIVLLTIGLLFTGTHTKKIKNCMIN
jgi:hypothetical protein